MDTQIGNWEDSEGDGESEIELLQDLIVCSSEHPYNDIIESTYPYLKEKLHDMKYLEERAILAPTMRL